MAGEQLHDDTGQLVGDYECQNGDGNRARVVLTDLETRTTDLLCGSCHLALMLAVADQLPAPESLGIPAEAAGPQ